MRYKKKKNISLYIISSVTWIFVILATLTLSSGCGGSVEEIELSEDKWALCKTVQPPIYVRFIGKMPGSNSIYGFISSGKPFSGSTPSPTPEKYSYGKGKIGETIVLSKITTGYDKYGKPSKTKIKEFVRFKIIKFDESKKIITIHILPLSSETR